MLRRNHELLLSLGGLLFAAGALTLFIRKTSREDWSDFPLLLVLLIPCVLLYALGLGLVRLGEDRPPARGDARPWQSVVLVVAILLAPLALFQFLETIDGSTDDSLNQAWIFLLTAALAAVAAVRIGAVFPTLLAALFGLLAWLALWDEILEPSEETVRYLLVVVALILAAVAVVLQVRRRGFAPDVMTGAGIAAVSAGILGIGATASQFAFGLAGGFAPTPEAGEIQQEEIWNVYLLLISLALVLYGNRVHARGPVYVGAFGLFGFIVGVGAEVSAFASGEAPDGSLVGWPLLLLLLGAAGLAAGVLLTARSGPGEPSAPEGPGPPAGAHAAGAPAPQPSAPPAPPREQPPGPAT